MTALPLYQVLGIPLVGLLNNVALYMPLSTRLDSQMASLRGDVGAGFESLEKLFDAKLSRVEETIDPRLRHLEGSLTRDWGYDNRTMRLTILFALVVLSPLAAQTAFVTGSGYTPPPGITVAPGQVATFYVGGLSQSFSALQNIIAVCSIGGAAQPVTVISAKAIDSSTLAITVVIPFSLVPYGASPVTIQFAQSGGTQTAPVSLNVASVLSHIINTCDVFYSASTTTCQLAITHQDGTIVTASSPAKGGEVLTVWALGLGVPASGIPAPGSGPIAMNDIILNTYFSETSPPATATPNTLSTPYLWAGLTSPATGLYQINFTVPQPPADLQSCTSQSEWFSVDGNLSVFVFRLVTITATSPVSSVNEGFAYSVVGLPQTGVASICVSQ